MRRQPSDRTLRRWLATGRPSRVTRMIENDPAIITRLEDLTALTDAESVALHNLVTPDPLFEERTTAGVQERINSNGPAGAFIDLLGLGFHVGRAVMGDRRKTVRLDESESDIADDGEW